MKEVKAEDLKPGHTVHFGRIPIVLEQVLLMKMGQVRITGQLNGSVETWTLWSDQLFDVTDERDYS